MNISIIIPTYNEEKRIERTLNAYCDFFSHNKQKLEFKNKNKIVNVHICVVLNGCTDNTFPIVQKIKKEYNSIQIINLQSAGKGLAIIEGFKNSVDQNADLIGFVDADMATHPKDFCELLEKINDHDGIIASRYMQKSNITPKKRLWIKEYGRKIIFNPLIKLLFGIQYTDYQCGAKIFKKNTIKKILPKLSIQRWAFDIELLYLCKKYNFKIKEVPTTWTDQKHTKFHVIGSGLAMIGEIIKLRYKRSKFFKFFNH